MDPATTSKCWYVKQEPESYSWEDLVRDKKTVWSGVRNFQARANLKQMRPGDLVLFYHTGEAKQVVGIAKVQTEPYRDPEAAEGEPWLALDLSPYKPLKLAVDLATLKKDSRLGGMALVRQGRLSVGPVSEDEFQVILDLAGTRL